MYAIRSYYEKDKEKQLSAGNPEGLAQRTPHYRGEPGHQQVEGGKECQLDMGQKRSGHGEEIELFRQVLLNIIQQVRREKKYDQGAAAKGQDQIADGFPHLV